MGEHTLHRGGVAGSSPVASTSIRFESWKHDFFDCVKENICQILLSLIWQVKRERVMYCDLHAFFFQGQAVELRSDEGCPFMIGDLTSVKQSIAHRSKRSLAVPAKIFLSSLRIMTVFYKMKRPAFMAGLYFYVFMIGCIRCDFLLHQIIDIRRYKLQLCRFQVFYKCLIDHDTKLLLFYRISLYRIGITSCSRNWTLISRKVEKSGN